MFQEGALFDSLSVYDNVAFPLVGGRVPTNRLPRHLREDVCLKVSEILARVGLTKAAYKMSGQLSGGMRRRVSLARALVARPKILLLDDPTSGLDPVVSRVIMDLIVELHSEYRPITFLVSHDLRRLLPVVERVLALFDGRIVFDGTVGDLAISAPAFVRSFVACRYELPTPSGALDVPVL
jgi:phospholipid/cholesterol/gamma-HCH transport system ATP-binding protein